MTATLIFRRRVAGRKLFYGDQSIMTGNPPLEKFHRLLSLL